MPTTETSAPPATVKIPPPTAIQPFLTAEVMDSAKAYGVPTAPLAVVAGMGVGQVPKLEKYAYNFDVW